MDGRWNGIHLPLRKAFIFSGLSLVVVGVVGGSLKKTNMGKNRGFMGVVQAFLPV